MNKVFLTGLKYLFLTSLVTAQTMAKSPASVPAANKAVPSRDSGLRRFDERAALTD
jgi:hypothetical protein